MVHEFVHLHRKIDRLTLLLTQMFTAQQRAFHHLDVEMHQMANTLDDLTAQVAENTDAEASAVILLGQLHDLIVSAGTDPAKLTALTTQLAASKEALAAAILANTPSA